MFLGKKTIIHKDKALFMSWNRFSFTPYVPVGQKLAQGNAAALALAKKEKRSPQPVRPPGREIAENFWGKAWCEHLKSMNDLDNRLDRGRRYLANGSVVDLVITPCVVKSLVAGSSTYHVAIHVKPLPPKDWERIKNEARKSIRSAMDLLSGKLSDSTIRVLTDPQKGIFPRADEVVFSCSCPDGAYVCKHVAAVFYGVGTLLDTRPELLFVIRDVDSSELVGLEGIASSLGESLAGESTLGDMDLEQMFGIELDKAPRTEIPPPKRSKPKPKKKPARAPVPKAQTVDTKKSRGKPKPAGPGTAPLSKAGKNSVGKPVKKQRASSTAKKTGKTKTGISKTPTNPQKESAQKTKHKAKAINPSKKSAP